ncbi:MAG: SpoIIE family protein phosphatase [Oscillospiraceae bacterium]|jgi:serine/threonine protein phosphatase PrpC|nr:SpoIIE family protein phosphatase [Oscillospiraceae bacterium]
MKKILNSRVTVFFLIMIGSYITARADINGLISPFNVALCCGLPSFYSIAVLIGTLCSYLFGGLVGEGIVYVIAMIMVTVIGIFTLNKTPKVTLWITFISMVTGVLSVGIYVQSPASAFITGTVIAVLTAFSAYFIRDLLLYVSRHRLLSLKGKNAVSLVFCYLTAIVTLCSFSVAYVNVGLMFVTFVILQAVATFGSTGGLVCGAFSSCGIFIFNAGLSFYTPFLSIIGYALGVLPKMKRVPLALCFMIFNMLVTVLIGVTSESVRCLISMTIGSACYIWIAFEKQIFDRFETPIEENIRKTTVQRLRFISNSMQKVKKNAQSYAIHFQKGKKYSKFNELQSVLYGQLEVSAELIGDLERKINENVSYDLDIIKTAAQALEKKGVKTESLTAYYNSSGRLFIEAYSNYEYKAKDLADELSNVLNLDLGYLDNVKVDDTYRFVFTSIADYGLDYHIYQKSGSKDACGDNYDVFYNGEGTAFVALSDGMGTGKRASVESKMLLNHFKRLIRSGIDDVPLAIRMINYIMSVKSDEDMFATLDLAKINLDNGETRLYKYGAGATLLKHNDEITVISDTSMPVGIMDKLEPFSEHKISLEPDDLLILLSDGVPESEYPHIKKLLLKEHNDLDLLAKKICKQANESSRDDITVIILNLV